MAEYPTVQASSTTMTGEQQAPSAQSSTSLGKYRLLAQIGRGGMADVFLAVARGPNKFNKFLVVKKMKTALIGDNDFIKMFNDEARLAARLNHPNIVQTIEAEQSGEDYFIVMEYLDGQPYHRVIHRAAKRGKELPLPLRLHILCEVLAGLHAAHELKDYDGSLLNVVHRDATPHNVFVTYQGEVKVVDFGIAKAAGRSVETRVGVIKGKVHYMAPEQALGKPVDRRVDVFAAGVMLWESITGKRLWGKATDLDVLRKLVTAEFPPMPGALAGIGFEVPEELDEICAKALAPRPADRYDTAMDLREDLERYLQKGPKPSKRDLSRITSELFAEERRTMKTVIETKVHELEYMRTQGLASGEFEIADFGATGGPMSLSNPSLAMSAPSLTGVGRGTAPGTVTSTSGSNPPSLRTVPPMQSASHAPPPRRGGSGWRTALVAGLLFSGGALFAVAAVRSETVEGGRKVPASEALAAPPVPTDTEVTLSATPDTAARIWIDGTPVANPFKGKYPRSNVEHVVRAAAPGYRAQTISLKFDRDVSRALRLEAEQGGH
jgi:eukaryotic-like serine/threonine-protein kinase